MKNKFIFTLITVISLIACSSSDHKSQPSASPSGSCNETSCPIAIPSAGPPVNIIAQENWQFTLGSGWTSQATSSNTDIKVYFINDSEKAELLFIKEATTDTYEEYVLNNIRALSGNGVKVSSTKQVIINGNKFILVQVNQDNTIIWTWNTLKNKYGYVFMCGGNVSTTLQNLCENIAQTVQIK